MNGEGSQMTKQLYDSKATNFKTSKNEKRNILNEKGRKKS